MCCGLSSWAKAKCEHQVCALLASPAERKKNQPVNIAASLRVCVRGRRAWQLLEKCVCLHCKTFNGLRRQSPVEELPHSPLPSVHVCPAGARLPLAVPLLSPLWPARYRSARVAIIIKVIARACAAAKSASLKLQHDT